MSAVFVKNLPFDMGEAAVQELFESSVGGEKFFRVFTDLVGTWTLPPADILAGL